MNPSESSDKELLKLQIRRRTLQSRMLMLFALGSTVVLVFCCVPLMVIQFLFGLDVTKDSAKVEAVARKIAPLAVPPKFTAAQSCSADNSVMQADIARFDHAEGRGRLVIGQLQLMMKLDAIPPEQSVKLLQTLVDELIPRLRTLETKQSRTKVVTIHGQEVSFAILEGEDQSSTTRLRHVTGAFLGPKGAFQLILQAESDFVTDESIDALLDSLADVMERPST